jgi:hypothetical protein
MNFVIGPIEPQSAAANVLTVGQQVNRPVLKLVSVHSRNLALQSLIDVFGGKGSAKKASDFDIAPKVASELNIIGGPTTKPEPISSQKIVVRNSVVHRSKSVEAMSTGK